MNDHRSEARTGRATDRGGTEMSEEQFACGDCEPCAGGRPDQCINRTEIARERQPTPAGSEWTVERLRGTGDLYQVVTGRGCRITLAGPLANLEYLCIQANATLAPPQPTPTAAKIAAEVAADLEDYIVLDEHGHAISYRTADAQEMIERAFAPLEEELENRDLTITAYAETLKSFGWKPADQSLQEFLSALQAELEQERENHAQLQARCYEGFPSVSDGIFDALKETQAELEQAREELKAYRERWFDRGDPASQRRLY